jgi:hypothetical protein
MTLLLVFSFFSKCASALSQVMQMLYFFPSFFPSFSLYLSHPAFKELCIISHHIGWPPQQ